LETPCLRERECRMSNAGGMKSRDFRPISRFCLGNDTT